MLVLRSTYYIDEIARVTYAVESDEDEDVAALLGGSLLSVLVLRTTLTDEIFRITYAVESADNEGTGKRAGTCVQAAWDVAQNTTSRSYRIYSSTRSERVCVWRPASHAYTVVQRSTHGSSRCKTGILWRRSVRRQAELTQAHMIRTSAWLSVKAAMQKCRISGNDDSVQFTGLHSAQQHTRVESKSRRAKTCAN